VRSAFGFQGQKCSACSRLIVFSSVHDELLERVVDIASQLAVGPASENHAVGPVISAAQHRAVLSEIDRGREEATLVMGGRPIDRDGGFYIEPTIFDGVDPLGRLAQHEIFGPVLSVHRWSDRDEVVRQANDVRYGLTGAIWTSDVSEAIRTAEELETGFIWINDVETRYPAVPFGGWKDSGSGLEHGIEELLSFTRTKAVNLRFK
jgi:acyl-CoA reductase-like NAD-dependent aldehyde dehydrogenase